MSAPQRSRLVSRTALAVAVLVAGGLAGCTDDDGDAAPSGSAGETTSTSVARVSGLAEVPQLVREVEPAVVAVLVETGGQRGEGSGVIVREDGVIVTNQHVVSGATEVRVALADGSQVEATVEATDPFTDLALLRVDRDGLPAVDLAGGYPEIGELAVAVGNPLGFENTVTAGIISGVGRALPTSATRGNQALVDLVQTDAAISPGNSGGALVGPGGEVIGINVAYLPPTTGAVSLGFAIPSPTVSDVVEELLADGTAEHAFLGVQPATVTEQIAQQFDLDASSGAAIVSVEPGTPAEEAELEPGDVVTAVDGEQVQDVAGLLTQLRRYDPGDEVELTVVSDDEETTVQVELASRPQA